MNEYTRISPKQLSILMNWSEERAMSYFTKVSKEIADQIYFNKDAAKDVYVEVPLIEKVTQMPIRKLAENVRKNFNKDKRCLDLVIKEVESKIKQNEQGFWPETIRIPSYISWLIDDEHRKELKDLIYRSLPRLKGLSIQLL